MIYQYEDPATDWEAYEWDRERMDADRLHCDQCGMVIEDRYYEIGDEILCSECMEEEYGRIL